MLLSIPLCAVAFCFKVFLFANSKCKRYFHNLKPSKLTWTAVYRKQHKEKQLKFMFSAYTWQRWSTCEINAQRLLHGYIDQSKVTKDKTSVIPCQNLGPLSEGQTLFLVFFFFN